MGKYIPKEQEEKIKAYWAEHKTFTFDQETTKEIYSIDTPPPTVSGKMHLGHAFSFSQQDFVARYKRLRGFEVFYPFGTDDNGLATEKLVQKMKKVSSSHMSRDEFIKVCTDFLKEERPQFIQDWITVGMSCDFDLCYSTIDNHARKIAQKTFLDLAKQNRVYQKEAPVIWDTVFQTAIAQAELEDIERQSFFNDIVFKTQSGDELLIGTTRPEMLSACVAVFAHPADERYKHLIGTQVTTPIYDDTVTVLADEKADPEKGTGLVMCCTFGDQTDIEWYKKHNLPIKSAIGKNGKMTELSGKYVDLKVADARKEIIQDLKDANLLRNQKEITQVVNVGERSGVPVEIIHSKQWYVKYLDKREDFLKASEELNWTPQHMKHRLDNWIKGLNWDWSISRQRSFGIPIPAWYDKEGNVYYADESQLPVDPLKDRPKGVDDSLELIPEKDVFDTWFTSGSTPFIATQLVKNEETRKKLFPMNLRPQAHDIINFWLFYTMAKTQLLHDVNPWKDVIISGFVLDPKGNKMSKSKGNVIAPQTVIEKYSADAIRYWAATSKLGDDLAYQEKQLVTANKLITKVWNAASFVAMHLEDFDNKKPEKLQAIDEWILAKLNAVIQKATTAFDEYEYSKARQEIEMFFWSLFCDNYLEIIKDKLYNPDHYDNGVEARKSAQYAVREVFVSLLKMFSPIIPFVTEAVYVGNFKKEGDSHTIHKGGWPTVYDVTDPQVDIAIEIIGEARRYKSDNAVSLKTPIVTLTVECDEETKIVIEKMSEDIKGTAKIEKIVFASVTENVIECGTCKLHIQL
jgi:valyl-tRNA synthetase